MFQYILSIHKCLSVLPRCSRDCLAFNVCQNGDFKQKGAPLLPRLILPTLLRFQPQISIFLISNCRNDNFSHLLWGVGSLLSDHTSLLACLDELEENCETWFPTIYQINNLIIFLSGWRGGRPTYLQQAWWLGVLCWSWVTGTSWPWVARNGCKGGTESCPLMWTKYFYSLRNVPIQFIY